LPADRQPLELLEERAVDQRVGFHWRAFTSLRRQLRRSRFQ
jgi:hypothetical protein